MNSSPPKNLPGSGSNSPLIFTLILTVVIVALGFAGGARTNPHLAWAYGGVAAFLLCWQAWLFMSSKGREGKLAWDFAAVPSHYVQAMVQGSVYVYWGWYWRNVYAEAPLILSQVAFVYVFDALVTWSRGQKWRLGFGAWPIIFSTNLFMWFRADWYIFQFVMVAIGVLGKQFVRWKRDGRVTHIFNPSAFGLTIVSLVLIFTGNTDHTWGMEIAHTQEYPPHLFTVIFLGGLVVQYFFSVTLLTFSAAAMLGLLTLLYTQITGVYIFIDTNISVAVFLGLHLLMTDPATTPRSSLGKVIFGSLYGSSVLLVLVILDTFHAPGFYDKLLVVPILNLLTPLLDRFAASVAAARIIKWEAMANPRKMNLGYMICWAALFVTMRASGFVEGTQHPGATLAFWKKAAEEKRPHAEEQVRHILEVFDRRNMDPDQQLATASPNSHLTQEQALGNLYDQVALIYDEGKLVPADPAKAALYFEKACEHGDLDGCANVAIGNFRMGTGGDQTDLDRAVSALEASGAASTNGRVCYIVGFAYASGQGRPLDMTKARHFFEKGAELGELGACQYLASLQLKGEGGPPDHAAAAHWLQKAADANDGPSCLGLAQMYHEGDGVTMDEKKANALLEKACSLGVSQACDILKASHN